jgi:hypothetical protein
MAEYIEREALIAEFKRLTLGENSLIERIFADGVYAVLETFPAADVVEVVRCGQCKHWTGVVLGSRCNYHSFPPNSFVYKQEHDFCSKGERRAE